MFESVRTAWSSASSFRGTDYRGGANGARIRFTWRSWAVNDSDEIDRVLGVLSDIQMDFNNSNSRRSVSLADLIVLAGAVAIEEAASQGGFDIGFLLSQVELTHPKSNRWRFLLCLDLQRMDLRIILVIITKGLLQRCLSKKLLY